MREIGRFAILCVLFSFTDARNVVKTLSVQNGGKWGSWHEAEFCPAGQFAVGYRMKIAPKQGSGDDSSLGGIKLQCTDGGTITSGVGPWGTWGTYTHCRAGAAFVAFNLQVEGRQGGAVWQDDTAANFVKFLCRDNDGGNTEVRVAPGGKGFWGDYGGWSLPCDPGSAICGLETRVERPQGNGDDTSLNDVRFFCCDD